MAYSVQTFLNDVATAIHGTTVNKVPGIYNIANRAARAFILDVDPKETQRIVQLPQVFNSVFDYPCPVDVKGDRVVDIGPQAGRMPGDVYPQGYAQDFAANQNVSFDNKTYTQWNTGIKTLRIEAPNLPAPLVLCDTSTVTGWTATSGAQNLSLDTTNNVAGGGDITFDLAAGPTTGSIQVSTLQPIDVSARVNIDTEYFWVYLPTGSAFTSLTLRWGSDVTANYYTYTTSVTQQGTAFQNGWNLIAMPWASATKVGTPVLTAFDSVQLVPTYNGTLQTGVKFCNLTSITGTYFQAQYYSKYFFRDPVTNAFQETIASGGVDDNKLINLDTDSYNLYFNKMATYVAQSLQGADADYDATFWDNEYRMALEKYKALNPSEAMLKSSSYYPMPRRNGYYRGWFGPGPR
jgi:hypothetical protein